MQKIYDVSLTKEPAIVSDDDTAEAEKYTFVLSYRIFENNGTFRKDIGDGYKRQYITVTQNNLFDEIDIVKNEDIDSIMIESISSEFDGEKD